MRRASATQAGGDREPQRDRRVHDDPAPGRVDADVVELDAAPVPVLIDMDSAPEPEPVGAGADGEGAGAGVRRVTR